MSDNEEVNIGLEHLIAGAIHANGGELVFGVEHILTDDIVDKQIHLDVTDGTATITLVDPAVVDVKTEVL